MKTSKIKGFSGHHDRQGCIQSPVHKNNKYEQRLEDLDGFNTFAATKTICCGELRHHFISSSISAPDTPAALGDIPAVLGDIQAALGKNIRCL